MMYCEIKDMLVDLLTKVLIRLRGRERERTC